MFTTSPSSQRRPWGLPQLSWLTPALLAAALVIGGCASPPTGTLRPDRDGPEANPPRDLDRVPDAEPRVESLRSGGPNKPYEVLGKRYVPFPQDRPFTERGLASWYGRKFHGRPTASGEIYDMYAMTAAHPTMPLPSYARVRNPANGREVVVRVNDRGPFHPGRIIDLSYTAALKLDLLRGVAPVEVERLTSDAIRAGTWRREPEAPLQAQAPPQAQPPPPPQPPPQPQPQPQPQAAEAPPAPVEAAPRVADAAELPTLPDMARSGGFWVQLGAFRQRDGAEEFQRRVAAELDWPLERLAVFSDAPLFRLQAGPYASRDEARSAAERIRGSLQLVPVVLERR